MAGDGIQSFSQATAEAKYKAGFGGGPNFTSPIMPPDLTVKMGQPMEMKTTMVTGSGDAAKIIDPWGQRKSK